jgi:hypothetical protein
VEYLSWLRVLLWNKVHGLSGGKIGQNPLATSGLIQRHSHAVMIPSLPKGVLNHGTPA